MDWTPSRPGAWYGGDFHVHTSTGSNDSDGISFVADHAEIARERGLSLVVITDHSNSAGSMNCEAGDVEKCPNQGPEFPTREDAAAHSGDGLWFATGVELSPIESLESTLEPTGHVGCLPRPGDPFSERTSAFVDRPAGSVPGGRGLTWCRAMGGFSVVNHPFAPASWVAFDWTGDDYDGLEVYNGGGWFDRGDLVAVDAWLCDLASGRETVPVGGSDCHQASTPGPSTDPLNTALGFPTTWMWASEADPDEMLSALSAGRVVVGDPVTRLDIQARDVGAVIGPGDTMAVLRGAVVEVRIQAETERSDLAVELLDVTSETCTSDTRYVDMDKPVADPDQLWSQVLVPGEPVDTVVEVSASAGRVLVARVWPRDTNFVFAHGVALAAPVRIVVR